MLPAAWLCGSVATAALDGGAKRRRRVVVPALLAVAAVLVSVGVELPLLAAEPGPPQAHAYASVVWTLAGFCAVHLLVAALLCAYACARIGARLVDAARPLEWRVACAFLRYAVAQAAIGWAVIHLFPVLQ
jgi:cytochrome c oxidase subunit I+III